MDCWKWNDGKSVFDGSEAESTFAGLMKGADSACIRFELIYKKDGSILSHGKLEYTLRSDGGLAVSYRMLPYPANLSRVGLELILPEGFEKLRYFGRGENENYCDRILSAPLGIYESTVDREHFAFNPPSENGGHEDCRLLTLFRGDKKLRIEGERPFHFDVRHNTIKDYQAAHEHELPKRTETYLHIDAAHAQIGGDMAWSTAVDENLMIGRKTQFLDFTMFME